MSPESYRPDGEDVFMDEDEAPVVSDDEQKDEDPGRTDVNEPGDDESALNNDEEEVASDA